MDLESLNLLRSPAGALALARAVELAPTDATFLSCFNRLEKSCGGALARAALQTALLRRRAAAKFSLADRMFFEREALEQSTAEPVARHRAARFAGVGLVADLCCGLGGDAVALAGRGPVLAVDRDPLRLALARLNVQAHGLTDRVAWSEADVLAADLSAAEGAFLDPDRRVGGRRQLSLDACEPPLGEVLSRLPPNLPFGAKLAPGVPLDELRRFDAEAEFVSLNGELKECALWFGPLRTAARRATLLPGGHTLWCEVGERGPVTTTINPRAYLFDPDPAILRAGLVRDLAERIGARQLDAEIAYLTGDAPTETPFARRFAVEADMPFHLRNLQAWLRERRVGRVQVMRRGSPIDPEELVRKLKLRGDEARTLVLTRVQGRPWALVVRAYGA